VIKMKVGTEKHINAQITILASYDGTVEIVVYDKDSRINFLDITMTHEQFINATMNRLGNSNVVGATLCDIDKVGKTMEIGTFEFEVGDKNTYREKEIARKLATQKCPDGWIPDLDFNSQNSFFNKDDKLWARTTIRRWA